MRRWRGSFLPCMNVEEYPIFFAGNVNWAFSDLRCSRLYRGGRLWYEEIGTFVVFQDRADIFIVVCFTGTLHCELPFIQSEGVCARSNVPAWLKGDKCDSQCVISNPSPMLASRFRLLSPSRSPHTMPEVGRFKPRIVDFHRPLNV